MIKAILALVMFMGPMLGGLVSMWWFNKYDMPRFLGNPQAFRTQILPASLGFMLLFIAGFLLYVLASQEAVMTLGAPVMWGWVVVAIGIFVPYFFSKKGQREWQYVPRWVKWYSRTLLYGGMVPFVVVGAIAIHAENAWFSLVAALLVAGIGAYILKRKKYVSDTHIDPAIVKAMQVRWGMQIWLMGAAFLLALGLLVGHWLGFF
jgi:LPXTG-motif cell wall-anchored protein